YDNTARLWDASTGQMLQELKGHQGWVNNAVFSQDGRRILTASSDNTARLWDVRNLNQALMQGCQYLTPYFTNHPSALDALKTCWTPERQQLATPALLREGDRLARQEKAQEAMEKYQLALAWNPNQSFVPTTRANNLAQAATLQKAAAKLAGEAKLTEAIAKYRQAKTFDEALTYDPEKRAKTQVIEALTNQAPKLAAQGKLTEATAKYRRAKALNPSLNLDPEKQAKQNYAAALESQADAQVRKQNFAPAVADYQKADTLFPAQITSGDWSWLCRHGSLHQNVTTVMPACEQAVQQAKTDKAKKWSHRSRGIAKGIANDLSTALADLRIARDLHKKQAPPANASEGDKKNYQKWLQRYESWVNDLESDRNPFTPSVIETLKKEL
ncbi:hypothetical protein IQ266_27470, partial [filamentous cyanobacterium LEGE 11480]|nr:hypothetical protein [Romeriopsis navalis LEGE 11480]